MTSKNRQLAQLPSDNYLINGGFDRWQRGTSLASGTAYRFLADRWKVGSSGTTNAPSQQVFTLGQTDVPGEPAFFHRVVVSTVAGTSNHCVIEYNVEDVRTLAGQTATLSFWAKADAAKPVSIEFAQHFGSGGTPSARVTAIGVQKLSLTTAWQKFTVTVTLPSIAGKTLGTDGNDRLQMFVWLDAGSSFDTRTNTLGQQSGTFDVAQFKLEEGTVATPFQPRDPATELALCQRYYWKSGSEIWLHPIHTADSGTQWRRAVVYFPVQMRATPTITAGSFATNGSSAPTSQGSQHVGTTHFALACDANAAASYVYVTGTKADAEL